jgi:hypothetical protein
MRPLLFVLLFLLAGACPAPPAPPPPPTGGVRLEGGPPEATVVVNERVQGTVGQLSQIPLQLRPGAYRLEVTADGYFPWYGEIEIGDVLQTVQVELRPVPQ